MATTKAVVTQQHLTDIAEAIRTKGGATGPLKPSEMKAAIEAIPAGGGDPMDEWAKPYEGLETQLYLDLRDDNLPLEIPIFIRPYVANEVCVDFGDGTIDETTFSNVGDISVIHTYERRGVYVLRIFAKTATSGRCWHAGKLSDWASIFGPSFHNNNAIDANKYMCIVKHIRIGDLDNAYYGSYSNFVYLRSVSTSSGCNGTFHTFSCAEVLNIKGNIFISKNDYFNSICQYADFSGSTNANVIGEGQIFDGNRVLTGVKTLGSAMTTIGAYVFRNATSLMSIDIPASVTRIKDSAFAGCVNMTRVNVYATNPPTVDSSNALGFASSVSIHIPAGTMDAYTTATHWSVFTGKFVDDL